MGFLDREAVEAEEGKRGVTDEANHGDPTRASPCCIDCGKVPAELREYVEAAESAGLTPDEYVAQEEGTYNPDNGHFLCTDDFVIREMRGGGRLTGENGGRWIAP